MKRIVRMHVGATAVLACATAVVVAAALCLAPTGALAQQVWLRGAGATFPAPLYAKWIDRFHAEDPAISITYDAVGSGEGISRFITGSVDFAGSDVRLGSAEAAKVPSGVITVPATAGMVVLAYNLPGFKGTLRLPRDVYPEIFAGRIDEWDDPRIKAANPGLDLPNRNIVIVGRQDSSGTTAAFTTHLAAIGDTWTQAGLGVGKLISWPASAMLVRGNEGVAARIKISEGSIGYVEYGFAKRLGLPMATVQNKSGTFVAPSEAAGQHALAAAAAQGQEDAAFVVTDPGGQDSYPMVTYSWLLLYRSQANAAKAAALSRFVSWGLTEGQRFAPDLGYIPLPSAAAEHGRQLLSQAGY